MEIEFDKNGLIVPRKIIDLPYEDLERIFVLERKKSQYRAVLYNKYLQYLEDIQTKIGVITFQFINGSFVTLKKKPKDIDIVTFIDYRIYRQKEKEIESLLEKWDLIAEIDGYIVPRSYPGHPFFIQAQLTFEYWKELFSSTRRNKKGEKFQKGFLKITFNE